MALAHIETKQSRKSFSSKWLWICVEKTYSFFRSFADSNYKVSSIISAGSYRPYYLSRPFLLYALIYREFTNRPAQVIMLDHRIDAH